MAGPASALFVLPQLSANHRALEPRSVFRPKNRRLFVAKFHHGHRTEEELDSEVEDGLTVKGSLGMDIVLWLEHRHPDPKNLLTENLGTGI